MLPNSPGGKHNTSEEEEVGTVDRRIGRFITDTSGLFSVMIVCLFVPR